MNIIYIFVKEINEDKRFMAFFCDGTITQFGRTSPKQGTYIDHQDKQMRTTYIKRHLKDLRSDDYKTAGFLSLFLIWNKEPISDSIGDLNKRIKTNNWKVDNLMN